ncbi:abortive infection system antitoxin AbiGi family protein [Photobacterium leiognathi]|uniref:abortive infection system antitoxin AbiGi family protein n=1 Tax=Photobacterium leiognathi TaxID=553611 RepID=UPI0027334D2A|nr:abortive infection system antitoxin AbiGi family protein [Photobacterium leiognathi]
MVKYCGEYFGDSSGKVISRVAHPMVSFSDYDHKELSLKKITYGGYGIALKKTWARENNLSPVNYVEKNSPAAQGLISLLRARQRGKLPPELRLSVIQLKCFTKHVSGKNSHFKIDNFDFKAENEWRYVPSKSQIGGNKISENFSTYNKSKDKYNSRLKPYSLKFNNLDIKYIYVQNSAEREYLIHNLGLSPKR